MSLITSLQLSKYETKQLPDTYDSASQHLEINVDLVISRTAQGVTVSIYGDDEWNMKMYEATGTIVFNFRSWCKELTITPLADVITNEMKVIQIARMHLFQNPRKPSSLKLNELNKLARLSLTNNKSLSALFEETNLFQLVLPSFSELETHQMRIMLSLFKELFGLRAKHPEFVFAPKDYSIIVRMQSLFDKHPKKNKSDPQQTKIIPSRLYASLINVLSIELDAFNTTAESIVEFFKRRKGNPLFGMARSRSKGLFKNFIPFDDAAAQVNLSSIFERRGIRNLDTLHAYIGEIQCAAKYWIHLFTGMRTNEARHLPANTYSQISTSFGEAHILRGYTSKVAGQNQTETFWMTAGIIEKGIFAAQHIGKITALIRNFDDSDQSQYPLFPALRKSSKFELSAFSGGPAMSLSGHRASTNRLLARLPDLIVQEIDIRELEQFDGFRDWRNDPDIKLGKIWPLATHQCRRSLAVYCARSGLVTVGSLGLQFKHLSEVMTSYYRRGSTFAANFLNTEDNLNFINEMEHERQKIQYLNYETNVINTTSRLWGGEGNRIQVARDKRKPLIITTDRTMTEKKFLKGEMAYKLGPIGGCTSLEDCNKISFTSIFACIDCENAILDDDRSLKNIKRGLRNLTREKAIFAVGNPRHQQLESEIFAIYAKLENRGLREKMEKLI